MTPEEIQIELLREILAELKKLNGQISVMNMALDVVANR